MRNISGDMLTHEVIKTSKTFYRSQDLQVEIGGNMAATDGKRVMLPSIPTNVDYTAEEVAVVRGFVDHEAGHGRHTNFKLSKRKPWKQMLKRYAHFMPIANGLEDVRIERQITQEYPGSKRNLEATSQWANNMYLEHYAEDPSIASDIARVGAVAITWEGRRRMGYDDPTITKCLDTLPADIRAKIEGAVDAMGTKKGTTLDMFKLSEKLLGEWGLDYDREQAEQEEQQRKGDGDGDADKTECNQQATEQSQAGQSEADEADDGDDTGSQGTASGEEDSDGGDSDEESRATSHGLGTAPDEAYDPNLDKTMQSIVKSKSGVSGSYTAMGAKYDAHYKKGCGNVAEEWWDDLTKQVAPSEGYDFIRKSIGSRLNKIRRNVERALVSTQERTWRGGYEEGQLDGRALVRGMAGSPNIYRKRQDTPDLDTSVMMVLDGSASMRGKPAELCVQAAIAMCEVFEKVDIPFSVTMFNTYAHEYHNKRRAYNKECYDFDGHGRGNALSTFLLKDYDTPLRQARNDIAKYSTAVRVGSANTDGDALMYIYQNYVMPRPEKRKIIMVFSDGEPVGTSNWAEEKRLQAVCKTLEGTAGVDLVGFGIMDDVSDYYSNNVSVHDIDQLAGETMKKVAQMLLGKRFKADAREAA